MTKQSASVVQKVWDSKIRAYRHRIVRKFTRQRLGSKRKAEALFARA